MPLTLFILRNSYFPYKLWLAKSARAVPTIHNAGIVLMADAEVPARESLHYAGTLLIRAVHLEPPLQYLLRP
jgi:hypothetical protein